MNLTIQRQSLIDALSIASAPVDSDPQQPILASVRLTLGADLELVGTDLVTTAVAHVPADGHEGACCANARTLIERVKLLPEGTIRLRLESTAAIRGGTLHIEGGSRKFALAVRDAGEFPATAEISKPAGGNAVASSVLASLLDRGGSAMSDDKGAQAIKRVVAITTADGWTETGSACNNAGASSGLDTGLPDHVEALIPFRGVEILRRFFGGKGNVRLEIIDRRIVASRDASSVAVLLADPTIAPASGHQYRGFGGFAEKAENAITITVSRAAIIDAVSAIASASEMHQVELYAEGDKLRIVGRSDQGEPAEDEIACLTDGKVESIVSGDLLTKMLRLATSDKVTIRIPPPIETPQPMMIKEIGELDARAWWIIMPIMPSAYKSRPEAKKASEKPNGDTSVAGEKNGKEKKSRKKKDSPAPEAPTTTAQSVAPTQAAVDDDTGDEAFE